MESDIYFQIVRKLKNHSNEDNDVQSHDNATLLKFWGRKNFVLIFIIGSVTTASSFIAFKNRQDSSLTLNMYIVEILAAIVGCLSYSSFSKKLSVWIKGFALPISIFLSILFLNPSTIIPQMPRISTNAFWIPWGFVIFLVTMATFYIGHNLVGVIEISTDLLSVMIPPTLGNPLPDVAMEAYEILLNDICDTKTWKEDLDYLITTAQAHLDSIEMRSLPWVVILGLGIFSGRIGTIYFVMGVILIFVGLLAIFNSARVAYLNTVIIQMGTRVLKEMASKSETNQDSQKDTSQNIYLYSSINKPGCLLGLFLPRRKNS